MLKWNSAQVGFAKAAHKLGALQYSPLDVNDSRWTADFAAYTTALGVLERKFAVAASAAIERAGSLHARMQLVMVRTLLPLVSIIITCLSSHNCTI